MGQYRENVIHYRLNPDPGGNGFDTANALVTALRSTFKSLWLGMLPQDYFLDAIFARQIGPTTGSYASDDFQPMLEQGTLGTSSTSQQLCPCITLIPPMGVKSAGRVFLPAVAATMINLNQPTAGYQTAISAFFTPSIAGFSVSGGTASIAIFSRKLNTSSEVSTFNFSPVIGYQRRRARPIGT